MKANLALALVGAALISLPAAAQTTPPATATPPAATTPKATTPKAAAAPLYEMKTGQWRAVKLAGVPVLNNNHESIGAVSDLIVGLDGKAEAVVIGAGGFLGMGEHLVAVPFDKVKWIDQPPAQNVSSRTSTTTSGSGSSMPSGPATTTSPAAGNSAATGGSSTASPTRTAASDAYRGYPDHAVVDMTKEQLRALPAVRYAR